ncbi:MAG TPA: Type 1 glutamine amidotransferase-like domain-containing protein [Anaerolineales bacterium]|jgi:peptidase E
MAVDLHLFSSPGEKEDIRYIIEASRAYLEGKPDARVAYMPLASLFAEKWLEDTESFFRGLARLDLINAELMTQTEIEAILGGSALVLIPGGNTFLLNHRLHINKIMPYLRKKLQTGLPLVAFSAGTILCGPNILTSKDMNTVGTADFDGLDLTPFNFLTHYALDAYGQSVQDAWLADYHFFHNNPVVMMCDGAYLQVEGKRTMLVRGEAWILRKDQEKEKIEPDAIIA